jgi:hypothetical protein
MIKRKYNMADLRKDSGFEVKLTIVYKRGISVRISVDPRRPARFQPSPLQLLRTFSPYQPSVIPFTKS